MPDSIPSSTLDKFTTFGDLLRFLRRRAGITQLELSIAVGYSGPQISRLEQNLRIPDLATIEARFITPLCLEDEPRAVSRLLELAATVRREDAPTLGMCPYKGLDYYDESDTDLFVGREELTRQLVDRVLSLASMDRLLENRFFTIVGASGSGKSSLVRAGLIPAIRWNKTSSNWPIYILTPTAHPLESLATALTHEDATLHATTTLMDELGSDPRSLSMFASREVKKSPGSYLLLVIDQFEEIFTLCRPESERTAFIDNLLTAANVAEGKAIIIVTLRADFYVHCSNYLDLRQALGSHQEYIGAMSDAEIRRAIEEPAWRGHWEFEPGLVDLIYHDVGLEPGALPLLSHALLETWQRRHGSIMTLSGYSSAGGVGGAIAETAETVYTDQLTHEQQVIARRIFMRLTQLGDETVMGDTRRKATIDELILKPENAEATQIVLKALADARLVTTSENSVQVAHEALIRGWPTLRGWLEDNRDGLRLHRQLTEAALDWQSAECEPDMLFRGARLAQCREWAVSQDEEMNSLEKEFLQASITFSQKEATEREVARQRELEAVRQLAEAERRSKMKLRQRAIYLSLALAFTLIMVVVAVIFARQALINARLAETRQATADSVSTQAVNEANIRATDVSKALAESLLSRNLSLANAAQALNSAGQGDLALVLAMEAANSQISPPEALFALRTVADSFGTRAVLSGHTYEVQAVAVSPDGKTTLSGSCAELVSKDTCNKGELILWDLQSMTELRRWTAGYDWVTAVAYNLDGQLLVSGSRDGSLYLWDKNGTQKGRLAGHSGRISDLAIITDSGKLLSASADGSMILWDLPTAKEIQKYSGYDSPISAIAVAPGNSTVVSAHQDSSLVVWDLSSAQVVRRFTDMGAGIQAVAISADGNRIIYSTSMLPRYGIRMIDSQTGAMLNEKTPGCIPGDMVLSPDQSYVFTSCTNGILLLDLQSWDYKGISYDSPASINSVSISQDGQLGLSGSQDGSLRAWNLSTLQKYRFLDIHPDLLTGIAMSPDGNYLLLSDAAMDGTEDPALWDLAQGKIIRVYPGFSGKISPGAIAINPNGRYIAAAGVKKGTTEPIVMVWDAESGELECELTGLKENGGGLAFNPNGNYLLVGSQIPDSKVGYLILYDVQSCEQVFQLDSDEAFTSIQFSQDGKRVLTGSSTPGRISVWDITSGQELKRFSYEGLGPIMDATFGPGDRTVLGTGVAAIYLWDARTTHLLKRYTGIHSIPWSLAVSPDGKYMLSGSFDGEVILWDFSTCQQLGRINMQNVVVSVAFSPDSKIAYAASMDGKLIEWHVTETPLSELLVWIKENRYVRELTEAEKLQYRIEP